MKTCELCKSAATIFCESDQARLCWDCDAKVHSANFLVARHSRSLLCHVCKSPTPWSASGSRLGKTVSVCESCVDGCKGVVEENRDGEEGREGDTEIDVVDDEFSDYDDDDDDDEDEDDGDDDEEDDGDNQVVPLSSSTPPPPPPASSSSFEESSRRLCNGDGAVSLKRLRENAADLHSDDDLGCSSSYRKNSSPAPPPPASVSTAADSDDAPPKRQRTEPNQAVTVQHGPAGSRIAATIVESIKRICEQDLTSGGDVSSAIAGICKLSENPGAIDLNDCLFS